ncbi:MAG: cytochrome c oxidase subunit [Thermoleophilaceae bacterium]|nr:cytochrome c oxidase subunit [Thermoleophilaceae bacterium]
MHNGHPSADGRRHWRRLIAVWAALTVALAVVIVFVAGPHLPPGDRSSEATDQRTGIIVLSCLVIPMTTAVVVYFAYALVAFRARPGDDEHPAAAPSRGNRRVSIAWVAASLVTVLAAAAFGTVKIAGYAYGAGGGQGPDPTAKPAGDPYAVQVIGQQWAFTFRYPDAGGVETTELALPVDRLVALHVTSLDVVHAFWAYGLGVKADAVPGADNVAYVRPLEVGSFDVACAELCGIAHGYMRTTVRVLEPGDFQAWIERQRTDAAAVTPHLPPYALTYNPVPVGRGG